ncbi:MAG TPA: hypothetical protein VFP39_10420, partial [Gemmatimonadales bacterium]|nr:hypothetical protein [Gemmatimonadales bacterium]
MGFAHGAAAHSLTAATPPFVSRGLIPRLQLFEIEDQAWCPAPIRDAMTDFLRFLMETFAPYRGAAPLLVRALGTAGDTRIIDLCSGGGGPWLDLVRRMSAAGGLAPRVRLTDWFPNRAAFARLEAASGGAITGDPDRVDATAVPARCVGFRTMFTALHHFPPTAAHTILADAVQARQGIAVFEVTNRTLLALLGALFFPLLVLLLTPFIRPVRWSRVIWTYLLPVLPVAAWVDATVSCLRTYRPEELRDLVEDLQEGYEWEIGTVRSAPLPSRVTYLVGLPLAR